jgi:RNA polymerase primary sigma factor
MNTHFSTYASYWIKQSLERALVSTAKTIRSRDLAHKKLNIIKKAIRVYNSAPQSDQTVISLPAG